MDEMIGKLEKNIKENNKEGFLDYCNYMLDNTQYSILEKCTGMELYEILKEVQKDIQSVKNYEEEIVKEFKKDHKGGGNAIEREKRPEKSEE